MISFGFFVLPVGFPGGMCSEPLQKLVLKHHDAWPLNMEVAGTFLSSILLGRQAFSTPGESYGAKRARNTLSESPVCADYVGDACVLTLDSKLPSSGKAKQGRCAYCRDYKTTWRCLKHDLMICQGGSCERKHMEGVPPVKRGRE